MVALVVLAWVLRRVGDAFAQLAELDEWPEYTGMATAITDDD